MAIAVTSHVGRDLLQNAAYFNSAPKVVMEYVSNSIDNAPDGQAVTVLVEITNSEIVITDDASGMSQTDLMHFFTMHGINRERKRGRKVRGRFGTGKSAAFGIADGLRVETIRNGRRNVVDLHRNDVLSVPDGSAIPVKHLVSDEPTPESNGTTVTVYDLQLDRIFITPIRERLERALGRHLDMHEVFINNRRLKYRLPDAVETFEFEPPAELLERMPNTSALLISVAREALTSSENGVAILSNGFLNAMTLGKAAGKAHVERIFGEVEAPDLDDEYDDEHFPAFDNTRDLSLNPQNPRALMLMDWVGASVEEVRKELDIEAQLARLSEVNSQMQNAADFVGDLINADFARVQRRLRVVAQAAVETGSIGSSEIIEIEVERPAENPEEQRLMSLVEPQEVVEISHADISSIEIAEPEASYPAIDYDEPDEPDAVPVPFEEPEVPELHEETTADEAYEAFVEYMTELDQLEEKAYLEAVMTEARAMPPEERKDVIRQVLLAEDKAEEAAQEIQEAPRMDAPQAPRVQAASGNGSSRPAAPEPEAPPVMVTDYRTQHVVSDHNVLVTGSYQGLQQSDLAESSGEVTYEERWVVDRDSFVAGRNPDAEPEISGNGTSDATDDRSEPKKFKKPRRRTYFHIEFEHMGQEAPRSRFAEEGRTIYINRDHPQVDYAEETEGVESLAYRNLMNEIVIQEYASAVVRQMAETGFYVADPFDAVETIQAVVNRLALEAGYRMQDEDQVNGANEKATPAKSVDDDDDDF